MNLDAYPVVLTHNLIGTADDLLDIIIKLGSCYSGIELYKISKGNFNNIFSNIKIFKNILLKNKDKSRDLEIKIN